MTLPLTGVRVADFSWVGAGPFMTKPLADHGAEVIKVESRTRTDVIRSMPPFTGGKPGVNRSGYFANRNSSKRSICLDLQSETGRSLALQLIAHCDIVVNNFTPGTLGRLGLGYEQARRVRPDVIYLDMPMQGLEGPHHQHRGYGLSIGALAGFYNLAGFPDASPVGSGTNYPDHVPNPLHGAIALLAALRRRQATGRGCHIEVAQVESTVNVIGAAIVATSAGHTIARAGNTDRAASPHGVYPCQGSDEWIAIAVRSDTEWVQLLATLDAIELGADPRFSTMQSRTKHGDALDRELGCRTRAHRAEQLALALCARDVPAARVATPKDVVRNDRQLASRGHWVTLDHAEMGPSIYDGIPYTLSRTPGRLRSAAPLLGADTRDVCTQILGMTDQEYELAHSRGEVG
jgi:benzylsuccinate CoA-transferase BbsF subunit